MMSKPKDMQLQDKIALTLDRFEDWVTAKVKGSKIPEGALDDSMTVKAIKALLLEELPGEMHKGKSKKSFEEVTTIQSIAWNAYRQEIIDKWGLE